MPTVASSDGVLRPIRWGVVGAGAIAGRFARDLAHVPDSIVASVFARRPEAAQQLAGAHQAVPLTSLDAFLTSGIDAVYIATLPDTHHHFARAALLAGLPVLCEKPLTRSLEELDDLLSLASDRNLLFMEAMKTPFLPLYRALRQLLTRSAEEGEEPAGIGPVSFVQAGNASVHTPPDHPSWRADLAGGALMAIGVYQAFLAVDWLGPAVEVQALGRLSASAAVTTSSEFDRAASRASLAPVDSFTLVQSRHAAGFSQIYAGLELASPGTATLCGPKGSATIHKPWWNPTRATLYPASGSPTELQCPLTGDGLHYETAHFCELLRSSRRESPIVTHAHSRAVIHLLDRARLAMNLAF